MVCTRTRWSWGRSAQRLGLSANQFPDLVRRTAGGHARELPAALPANRGRHFIRGSNLRSRPGRLRPRAARNGRLATAGPRRASLATAQVSHRRVARLSQTTWNANVPGGSRKSRLRGRGQHGFLDVHGSQRQARSPGSSRTALSHDVWRGERRCRRHRSRAAPGHALRGACVQGHIDASSHGIFSSGEDAPSCLCGRKHLPLKIRTFIDFFLKFFPVHADAPGS